MPSLFCAKLSGVIPKIMLSYNDLQCATRSYKQIIRGFWSLLLIQHLERLFMASQIKYLAVKGG